MGRESVYVIIFEIERTDVHIFSPGYRIKFHIFLTIFDWVQIDPRNSLG
jgi:hypothetical protein